MGRDSSKDSPQPVTMTREVRPVHGIFVNGKLVDYALAPMDVAREKELQGGEETALGEKDSSKPDAFVRRDPDYRNLERIGLGELLKLVDKFSDDEKNLIVQHWAVTSPAFAENLPLLAALFGRSATPPPAPILPDKAPRLWTERPADERGMNATDWIRKVYARWLGHGLARHHIGELDPELGRAYSGWTRKDRHPEDIITEFAEGNPYGRLDDGEAGRRNRASTRASQAKAKAAKMPHPT